VSWICNEMLSSWYYFFFMNSIGTYFVPK
jgi:hypothetical protein